MEVAQQYRWEAQRLRQLAEMAASENVRAELLNIAAQFEQLAEEAERDPSGADQPGRLSGSLRDYRTPTPRGQ